jgi:hypothetical protein
MCLTIKTAEIGPERDDFEDKLEFLMQFERYNRFRLIISNMDSKNGEWAEYILKKAYRMKIQM